MHVDVESYKYQMLFTSAGSNCKQWNALLRKKTLKECIGLCRGRARKLLGHNKCGWQDSNPGGSTGLMKSGEVHRVVRDSSLGVDVSSLNPDVDTKFTSHDETPQRRVQYSS